MYDIPIHGILAYLDPLSGSVLVQGLLAAAAAAVVFFKMKGRQIKSLFSGRSKDEDVAEDSEAE